MLRPSHADQRAACRAAGCHGLVLCDVPATARQLTLWAQGCPGAGSFEEPSLASAPGGNSRAPKERPPPLRTDSNGAAAPQPLPQQQQQQQQQPNLPPLAYDVRLPPLHPKLASQLHLLAAGHGSAFAGATPLLNSAPLCGRCERRVPQCARMAPRDGV